MVAFYRSTGVIHCRVAGFRILWGIWVKLSPSFKGIVECNLLEKLVIEFVQNKKYSGYLVDEVQKHGFSGIGNLK